MRDFDASGQENYSSWIRGIGEMAAARPIKVLVVDDHEMLRNSLSVFFDTTDDLELVGQATTGLEALELCAQLQPDVVLMDLKLPDMDGVTATRILRKKYPQIRVIVLTYSAAPEDMQAALDAGVHRYLLKDISIDELAVAIRDAIK